MSSGQWVRVSQGELQAKVVPSQGSHRAENAPNAARVPNSPQSYSGKGLEETTSKFPNIVGREGASVLPFPAGGATLPYALQAGYPNTTGLQDWGEAPDVSVFYGRTEELTTLEQWIVNDRCRLVTLLGMGGIGKTTLSVKLTQQIQEQFEYIIWRSLIEKTTEAGEGCFMIQPVVMKYVTSQLIHEVCQDIIAALETQDIEKIGRLRSHALVKEQEHDEINEIQYRLILTRVKDKLSMMLRGSKRIKEELNELLLKLEGESPTAIGYALGNVRLLATLV